MLPTLRANKEEQKRTTPNPARSRTARTCVTRVNRGVQRESHEYSPTTTQQWMGFKKVFVLYKGMLFVSSCTIGHRRDGLTGYENKKITHQLQ